MRVSIVTIGPKLVSSVRSASLPTPAAEGVARRCGHDLEDSKFPQQLISALAGISPQPTPETSAFLGA